MLGEIIVGGIALILVVAAIFVIIVRVRQRAMLRKIRETQRRRGGIGRMKL